MHWGNILRFLDRDRVCSKTKDDQVVDNDMQSKRSSIMSNRYGSKALASQSN